MEGLAIGAPYKECCRITMLVCLCIFPSMHEHGHYPLSVKPCLCLKVVWWSYGYVEVELLYAVGQRWFDLYVIERKEKRAEKEVKNFHRIIWFSNKERLFQFCIGGYLV